MKTKQQQKDYESITWAWNILRDMGDPEDTPEYWKELYRRIMDYPERNSLREKFGVAIQTEMEERARQ